ncbi:MAG: HAD-IA family hydrolase, partial [Bacillota bacterium]|nr:HAD-IA family hydrolase [Bacillota bacterium]
MRNIDTILFDFDGTIMDTNNVILMSWQHTFKTLENREEDESKLTATFGEPLERTLERFFPNVPVEESIKIYRNYQRSNFSELITLFPGMKELVMKCKARGYKTGLVTSRLKITAMEGLDKFDLEKYFDVIITPEDTDKHKPDPAPVNIALERLGSKPENAVMLGDTLFDIQCSHNAGIGAVLVSWTMALAGKTKEDLGEDAPDYIINSPDELFDII